jgi:hypothetical protein
VTTPGKTPGGPGTRRQADGPYVPAQRQAEENQRLAEENWRELQDDPYDPYDPYDLLFPDEYEPGRVGRAEYVIVVDQARGWNPGGPPSLAELLETGRTREPEPDLEAEP